MGKIPLELAENSFDVTPSLALVRGQSQQLPQQIPIVQLRNFADDWLSEAEYMRQSPDTIYGKRDTLKKLLWFLERSERPACNTRDLRAFIAHVANGHEEQEGRFGNPKLRDPASDRTIEYYFNYMRGFFRWMVTDPTIPVDFNLAHGLRVPKPKQSLIQPFTADQLNALLLASRHSGHPKRDEAILLFMLDTGARAAEVCGLRYCDVVVGGTHGQAKVLGKGRKERILPFSRRAARMLWRYLQETPGRQPLSPLFLSDRGPNGKHMALKPNGLLQLFERLGQAANLSGVRCSPHTMRHTFAISFLRAGGNTFTLQTMLGHTALHMTQKYVALAQADIETQHRQFSPADQLG